MNSSVAIGLNAVSDFSSVAIGSNASAVGPWSSAYGTYSRAAMGASAFGTASLASGADSVAFGYASVASGAQAQAIGVSAVASAMRATAIGAGSKASANNSVSIGSLSAASVANAVAIGYNSKASHAQSIAVGTDSATAAAVGTMQTTINGKAYAFAGATPVGTMSIGSATAKRTLTNLAAGRLSATSTDGVNGSQLFATNTAIGELSDRSVQYDLKPDGTINYNNITLGGDTYNSVTHTGGTTITNVAEGVNPGDAVNFAQLTQTNNNVSNIYNTGTKYFHANSTGTDSIAGGLDSVAIGMGAVANNMNDVALGANSKTASAVATTDVTINGVTYAFAGTAPTSTVSIGSVGAERTLTNLAAGRLSATSTDGVNGSQLFATNTAVENLYTDVGNLRDDALLWDPTLGAFSASHGTSVVNKITNVADGDLNATSTDAVNGSQLYATNQKVENIDYRLTNVEDIVYNNIVPTMRYLKVNSNGPDAIATGADAIALGQSTVASGDNSIATGNGAQSSGNGAIAMGNNSSASGTGSVAIGDGASVTGNNSVALGAGSVADRDNTVSVGSEGNERQITNVAAGTEDTDAVNVGQLKEVAGDVTNIGNVVNNINNGKDGMFHMNNTDNLSKPSPTGTNSLAGGAGASATGNNSMAVGTKASSSGANSVALGNGASSKASNSVALGAGSVADRANSVSVGYAGGERQITNVAAGTADTDAVNVSQLKQSAASSNQYVNNKVAYLKNMIDDQKDKMSAGIAGAMAMSGLPQPYSPGASMVGIAGGTYQGQSAIALGVSTISDNGKWVTKLSGSTNSQNDFGVAVGVGYQW